MRCKLYAPLLLALALSAPAAAKDEADKPGEPVITPPPPPEELTLGEDHVEPKVTIVRRDWATIEEYSINGRVYAVKITPRVGFPYYLYDSDGDGSLETRRDGIPELPHWKILTW